MENITFNDQINLFLEK